MNTVKKCFFILFLISLQACELKGTKQVDFLVGTWKIEGKETYESWKKVGDKLKGESYKMKEGQKYVSETLEIKPKEEKIIYTATVLNQNEGKAIPFTLNMSINELYSFENLTHDFPNKIQYKILSDTELQLSVLGKDGKGFSYKMARK